MVSDRRLLVRSLDRCFHVSPHLSPPVPNFLLPPLFLSRNGWLGAGAGGTAVIHENLCRIRSGRHE